MLRPIINNNLKGGSDTSKETISIGASQIDTTNFVQTDTMGIGEYLNKVKTKDDKNNSGLIFESSKPIFESFLKAIDQIKNIERKNNITSIIKELNETDDKLNEILQKILLNYESTDLKGIEAFTQLQFGFFETQVNALRVLLKKEVEVAADTKGNLEELLRISTKKLDLINKMILGSQEITDDNKNVIVDPNVKAARDEILQKINSETGKSSALFTKFDQSIVQQGGKSQSNKEIEQWSLLRTKFDKWFSGYKFADIVSIVFLMGYPDEIKKLGDPELVDIVTNIIKHLFINIDIFPEDTKEYSLFDKSINKILSKIDKNTNLGNLIEKHTKIYKKFFPEYTERVIFIPQLLGLIKALDNTTYGLTWLKDKNDLIEVYSRIGQSFDKLLESYNKLTDLPDNVKALNSKYEEILNKTKVVFAYMSERTDNMQKNPRFTFDIMESDFTTKEKPNVVLTYIESNKEGNTLPEDAEKYIFPFGTLDGFFKQKKSKEISNKVFNDIKNPFMNGEIITLFGIGQSGSGKTSLLIFRDSADAGEQDGVVIEVLKNKEVIDKYEKLTLQVSNIYTNFPSDPFQGGDNRYVVTDLILNKETNAQKPKEISFYFNQNASTWVREGKTENIADEDKIGQIIINTFDKERQIEPTTNNPNSSRSHVVLCIKAIPKNSNEKIAKLLVCDLAGAENKFQCKGNPNDLEKFFNIYTGKAREGEWDKYMRKIYFEDYKCLANEQKSSDKQLDEITEDISSYVDSYNTLLKEKKLETNLQLQLNLSRAKIGNYCDNPLPYDGESIKEKLEDIDGEAFNEADYEKNLYNKAFELSYKDLHKFDFYSKDWRNKLDSLGQSFQSTDFYSNLFNDVNNNNNKKQFYQTLYNYIHEFGIYTKSTGMGSQPDSISIAKEQITTKLESVDTNILNQFENDWKTISDKLKSKYSNELKSDNEQEDFAINKVLESFKDFMAVAIIGLNSEDVDNTSVFNIYKGGLNESATTDNTTTEYLTIIFGIEKDYDLTIKLKKYFTKNDWEMSTTNKLFGKIVKVAQEFLKLSLEPLNINAKVKSYGRYNDSPSSIRYLEVKSGSSGSGPEAAFIEQRKMIYEHLTLARLYYSCYLRVEEGYFINQALFENQKQISDLIIQANLGNIKDDLLYWDTKSNPLSQNYNLTSDTVFTVPTLSKNPATSIIIQQILKLAKDDTQVDGSTISTTTSSVTTSSVEQPKIRFVVFTVVNTSDNRNNPPNPPYFSLNALKFHYINNYPEQAVDDAKKLLAKAKENEFYKNNDKVRKLKVENISKDTLEQDYANMISIFEKNNSTTLVGTVEATQEFLSLNYKYLSFNSEEVNKIEKAYRELDILSISTKAGTYSIDKEIPLETASKYVVKYDEDYVDV